MFLEHYTSIQEHAIDTKRDATARELMCSERVRTGRATYRLAVEVCICGLSSEQMETYGLGVGWLRCRVLHDL